MYYKFIKYDNHIEILISFNKISLTYNNLPCLYYMFVFFI